MKGFFSGLASNYALVGPAVDTKVQGISGATKYLDLALSCSVSIGMRLKVSKGVCTRSLQRSVRAWLILSSIWKVF